MIFPNFGPYRAHQHVSMRHILKGFGTGGSWHGSIASHDTCLRPRAANSKVPNGPLPASKWDGTKGFLIGCQAIAWEDLFIGPVLYGRSRIGDPGKLFRDIRTNLPSLVSVRPHSVSGWGIDVLVVS